MQKQAPLTPEQLARDLGIKASTVRRWIREGKLGALRIGGRYRIPLEDAARMETRLEVAGDMNGRP